MDTENKLLKLINEIKNEAITSIDTGDNFIEKYSLDSLDVVSLITRIGQEFGTPFGEDPSDLDSLTSFGKLVDWINVRHAA